MLRGLKKPWKQALAGLISALMVFGVIPVNPYSSDGGVMQALADTSGGDLESGGSIEGIYKIDLYNDYAPGETLTADVVKKDSADENAIITVYSSKFSIQTNKDVRTGPNGDDPTEKHNVYQTKSDGAIKVVIPSGYTGKIVVSASNSGGNTGRSISVPEASYTKELTTKTWQTLTIGDNLVAGTYNIGVTGSWLWIFDVSVTLTKVPVDVSGTYSVDLYNDYAPGETLTADVVKKDSADENAIITVYSSKFSIQTNKDVRTGPNGDDPTEKHNVYQTKSDGAIKVVIPSGYTGKIVVSASNSGGNTGRSISVPEASYTKELTTKTWQTLTIGDNLVAGTYNIGVTGSWLWIFDVSVTLTKTGTVTNAPTVSTVIATQDTEDKSKVTITGTGTAGDEGSKYVVVRVDGNGTEKEVATSLDGTQTTFEYVDTLTSSGTYTYKAYGKGSTNSDAVTAAETITYAKALGKPSVSAIADDTKVSLSWGKVDEADSYDVLVYQGDTELTEKAKTGLAETSYEVTGLTNGTEYGFVVAAHRSSDDAKAESDKKTATPKGPETGVTWFRADKMTAQNYTTNTAFDDGSAFNLVTATKTLTVDASTKETTDGEAFAQRLKFSGKGSTTEQSLKITVAEKSYIVVYALSSSKTDARKLALVDSTGAEVKSIPAAPDASTETKIAPSNAISLEAGDYYLYSGGSGINIYGVKLKVGDVPLTPWADVKTPVIDSLTYDKASGKITAEYIAEFADVLGADSGIISLLRYDESNSRYYEIKSVEVNTSGKTEFDPPMEGTYAARFSISRSGEADKVAEEKTVIVDVLPPSVPNITWVNNLGNGSVYVDWNNVDADQGYDVEYKAEGADGYTTAVTGLTQGNYTISGLASGTAYTVRVTAKDSIRGSKSDERGFTVAEPKQEWYADVFGSATSGTMTVDGTEISIKSYSDSYPISTHLAPDVTNGNGTIVIAPSDNGKVADSEEGIEVYYTRINPNTENFKLTATFTVTDDSTVNNQSGFGIYALDIAGLGTKDAKYLNNVTVGNYKFVGGTYHSNGVRYVTGLESYDPTSADGRVLNNTLMFDKQKDEDTSVNGDSYTYTLEKTDEGFIGTMVGASESIFIEDASKIMTQEDGSIILALAAARVGVTISDIHFEKTEGSVGGGVETTTTPTFKVHSSNISSMATYEFSASSNVAGTLALYNDDDLLAEGTAEAGEAFVLPVALWISGGENAIRYVFTPDPSTKNLTSYAPITGSIGVKYGVRTSASKVIYTAPNAQRKGDGTKDDPKELQAAIDSALPGQTIVMLDGVYSPYSGILIPRNVSGTADEIITLVAETPGNVTLNGAALESDSSLFTLVGSYWHVYGIEFCDTPGKCVNVCGNNNTIEMCTMHDSANAGVQISRYSGEPNDKELWPANNLIKNCESYNHCDPGRSDADGFAAKLTCGEGNVFDGCISHHNIDDGWDLYAKSTTGSIGQVVVKNCITYSNGWLLEDEDEFNVPRTGTEYGEGNGFKLGGENMYGNHQLINCISYNNHAKGITSNSGPDCEVYNCTAFNNSLDKKSYNYSLYTKASNNKAWILEGALSVYDTELNPRCTPAAELGDSNGVVLSLRSATNYLYDGSKSLNTESVEATSDWFENVDVTVRPTRNADGTINMHGLLVIKEDKPMDTGARLNNATSVQPDIPEQDASLFSDDGDDNDNASGSGSAAANYMISELPITNHTATEVIVVSTMAEAKDAAGITGSDSLEVEIDVLQNDNPAMKLMQAFVAQNKLTLSKCFDINVYRVTKEGVRVGRVTEFKKPIKLLLKVPEGVDSSQYDFGVIRVHDGVVELLKDTDNTATTISVASDKFSPYAIVYGAKGTLTDVKAVSTVGVKSTASKPGASPKTFDESRFVPEITETEVAEFAKKQVEKQLEQEAADLLITPQATRFPYGIIIAAVLALAAFIGGEVIYFRRKKNK